MTCTGQVGKLILCLVNLTFLLLSLCVIYIGSRIQFHHPAPSELDLTLHHISLLLIVTGLVIGVISTLGFTATLLESPSGLAIYVYIVSLCACALVGANLGVWIYRDVIFREARHLFARLVTNYSETSATARHLVEQVQSSLLCCGDYSPLDWWYQDWGPNATQIEQGFFPGSCCGEPIAWTLDPVVDVPLCSEDGLLYLDGCFGSIQKHRYSMVLQWTLVVMALGLVLLLSLACCLQTDQLLLRSQRVNLSYAAHLTTCPVALAQSLWQHSLGAINSQRPGAWLFGTTKGGSE